MEERKPSADSRAAIIVALIGAGALIAAAIIPLVWEQFSAFCVANWISLLVAAVLILGLWKACQLYLKHRNRMIDRKTAQMERECGDKKFEMALYEEAIRHYQKAVVTESDYPLNNQKLSDALFQFARILEEEAQSKTNPKDALELMKRCNDALRDAAVQIAEARRKGGENKQYINQLISIYIFWGRYLAAKQAAKNATKSERGNAEFCCNYGIIEFYLGHYKEALKAVQSAIDKDNSNARYHNVLASILYRMQDDGDDGSESQKKANEEAQIAVELEENNAGYHSDYSQTLFSLGKESEALKQAREAVRLERRNARYRRHLGIMLCRTKKYNEAKNELKKAVEIAPLDSANRIAYAEVLETLGCSAEAQKQRQKVSKLDPIFSRRWNDYIR